MNNLNPVNIWTDLRKQIIQAQMASVIILSVALYLLATGEFSEAPMLTKAFAIAVLFSTGVLSLISQFAVIREGTALIKDLQESTSALEKVIAKSARYLQLTQVVMVAFALATFGLFVVAVW